MQGQQQLWRVLVVKPDIVPLEKTTEGMSIKVKERRLCDRDASCGGLILGRHFSMIYYVLIDWSFGANKAQTQLVWQRIEKRW